MQALELRKTQKYVGQWKHLDEWEYIGEFKELGVTTDSDYDEDDPCESRTDYLVVRIVKIEDGTTDDEIVQALRDVFTSHGCSHEYDCCGCRSYRATHVDRLGSYGEDMTYVVTVHSSRNF